MDIREVDKLDISQGTLNLIPLTCSKCGSSLQVSSVFKNVHCENVFCTGRVVQRCVTVLQYLKIKNFGEAFVRDLVGTYKFTSPLQMFVLELEDLALIKNNDSLYKKAVNFVLEIEKFQTITIEQFLNMLSIDGLGYTSARLLASSVDSFEEFLGRFQLEGIDFIREALDISELNSQKAISIAYGIKNNLKAIEFALATGLITVTPNELVEGIVLNIVASGSIGFDYGTKQDFYDFLEDRYEGLFHFNVDKSVTKATNILIIQDGANTSKGKKALRYKEDGLPIEVLDAEETVQYLDALGGV